MVIARPFSFDGGLVLDGEKEGLDDVLWFRARAYTYMCAYI